MSSMADASIRGSFAYSVRMCVNYFVMACNGAIVYCPVKMAEVARGRNRFKTFSYVINVYSSEVHGRAPAHLRS